MKDNQVPTQDEKVTSALAHAAVILPMWGIIITAVFWATQREKSKFIQDQTLQALSWQVLQVVMMFVSIGCYMASFFLMMGSTFMMEPQNMSGPPAGFFLPFCVMGLYFLSFIFFIFIGIGAAFRVIQGHRVTYPIIGGWVRGYMEQNNNVNKSDLDLHPPLDE